MSINPEDKMINGERMEKWVLRKAFESYLPESVAWRQKEQFSDGKIWEQEYEKGKAMYPVKGIGDTDDRGTAVTFLPDPSIFQTTTEYNYDTLASRMRELAYLNKGIKISLSDKRALSIAALKLRLHLLI